MRLQSPVKWPPARSAKHYNKPNRNKAAYCNLHGSNKLVRGEHFATLYADDMSSNEQYDRTGRGRNRVGTIE
jgi:hypothetical protein